MLEFGTKNKEITSECTNPPFVLSVNDTPDNELIILLALPKRGEKGSGQEHISFPANQRSTIQNILKDAYPIVEDMTRIYEIRFERYILHLCRNESYTAWDAEEKYTGKYLILYDRSKLLDFYQSIIFDISTDKQKAKRKHYGILAANHVLDIISDQPPVITKITQE